MIYIVGGPGKTGSSTVAKKLSNHLKCNRYYGGGYIRRESIKLLLTFDKYTPPIKPQHTIDFTLPEPFVGLDLDQVIDWDKTDLDKADLLNFRDYCIANDRDIDEEMELYLLKGMMKSLQKNVNVVIESKTMARLLHTKTINDLIKKANELFSQYNAINLEIIKANSKSLWLHANADVRASRSLYKKYLVKQGKEDKYIIFTEAELKEEVDLLLIRQTNDNLVYNNNYKIPDYPLLDAPSDLFGYIIDSSEQSQDDTFKDVLKHFNLIDN